MSADGLIVLPSCGERREKGGSALCCHLYNKKGTSYRMLTDEEIIRNLRNNFPLHPKPFS